MIGRKEHRVVIAGDWHGNAAWIGGAIPAIAREAPGVRTILHVGDFGIYSDIPGKGFLSAVDFWCERAGIERVLVTPGNHEDWDWLEREFAATSGLPVQLSETVSVLPRGYRFELGGVSMLSFGGAASIDYERRTRGISWFPSEMPTDVDVTTATDGGAVDVLIAHETINGGTAATEAIIASNPMGWSGRALEYSRESRRLVTQVWEATTPRLMVHGHMHADDEITLPSGQHVISLGRDGHPRNTGVLELSSLTWTWLAGPRLPERVRRSRNWESQYLTRPTED